MTDAINGALSTAESKLTSDLASKANAPEYLQSLTRTIASRNVTLETWNTLINAMCGVASDSNTVADFIQALYKNCVWSVKGDKSTSAYIRDVILALADFGISRTDSELNNTVFLDTSKTASSGGNLYVGSDVFKLGTANVADAAITNSKLSTEVQNILAVATENLNYIGEQVSSWLATHPDATTTVQDKSLTLNKFKDKELPFVTPELFGAVGDKETDDTEAIQKALDSGSTVWFDPRKTYFVTNTLNVPSNRKILNANLLVEPNEEIKNLFFCENVENVSFTNVRIASTNQYPTVGLSGYTNWNSSVSSNIVAFSFRGVKQVYVKDIVLENMYQCFFINADVIGSNDDINIDTVYATGVARVFCYAGYTKTLKLRNCTAYPSSLPLPGTHALYMGHNCENILIDNFRYEGSDYNSNLIQLGFYGTLSDESVKFNATVKNCYVKGGNPIAVRHNNFDIYFENCNFIIKNYTVSSGTCNSHYTGIDLGGEYGNVRFNNCKFSSVGDLSSSGILIDNAHNSIIDNNTTVTFDNCDLDVYCLNKTYPNPIKMLFRNCNINTYYRLVTCLANEDCGVTLMLDSCVIKHAYTDYVVSIPYNTDIKVIVKNCYIESTYTGVWFRNEYAKLSVIGSHCYGQSSNIGRYTTFVNSYMNDALIGDAVQTSVTQDFTTPVSLRDAKSSKIPDFSITGNSEQSIPVATNLLSCPYYTTAGTTNGLTFTVNANGDVVINGTATATTRFYICRNQSLSVGVYTLSGCPTGGASTAYDLQIYNATETKDNSDYGSGVTFTYAAADTVNVSIRIQSGQTVSNLTFKPQLKLVSPSPYHLVDIENTGDTLKLTSCGEISSLFPIGSEITINRGDNPIVWRVVDYNHFDLVSGKTEPMLTLEMKYLFGTTSAYKDVQFDEEEALYYAETGLAAGTYYFTVANQSWRTTENGKTYQFTLTSAVPAGGQIVISDILFNAALEGKSVKTYASGSSSTVIETATLTEGSAGTNLGTTDGMANVNHMHRILFGSNNYAQSAMRQWLNSSEAAGSVWAPQTKWDRTPSWAGAGDSAYAGFMNGLDSDFLAVVEPAVIPCRTNSVHEVNSLDGTAFAINQTYNLNDKFFLLSRPEVYGTWDSTTYKDGELLDYYDGLTGTEQKRYDSFGSVHYAWLRSPYPGSANSERIVNTGGSVDSYGASNSNGAAAVCVVSVANMAELIKNGKATYSKFVNVDSYSIPLTDTDGTTHTMRKYDKITKHDDGKWYFDCNSNVKTFTGTENWNKSTSYLSIVVPASTEEGRKHILCNYFKGAVSTTFGNAFITGANNDSLVIGNADGHYATLDAWKSQLAAWNTAGTPLTVLYETATATSYELNAAAQDLLNSIALKYPNTSLYFTNDLEPTMRGQYCLDVKKYIDKKFTELEALILENNT